jgi:hypothetical protein
MSCSCSLSLSLPPALTLLSFSLSLSPTLSLSLSLLHSWSISASLCPLHPNVLPHQQWKLSNILPLGKEENAVPRKLSSTRIFTIQDTYLSCTITTSHQASFTSRKQAQFKPLTIYLIVSWNMPWVPYSECHLGLTVRTSVDSEKSLYFWP